MTNSTLNVDMPDPLRNFVHARVQRGDYADEGEYLRDLVRRDRKAQAAMRLRELIEAGLVSGPPREMSEADWTQLREVALVDVVRLLGERQDIAAILATDHD